MYWFSDSLNLGEEESRTPSNSILGINAEYTLGIIYKDVFGGVLLFRFHITFSTSKSQPALPEFPIEKK